MNKVKIVLLLSGVLLIMLFIAFQTRREKIEIPVTGVQGSEAKAALDFWGAQRAYPREVIPDDGFYKAFEYAQRAMRKEAAALKAQDTWTSIGPANRGGRTIALEVDPQNPDVIYAGAASGGLWRLTMDGNNYSWEYIDTGFPVLGVNAIAVDPTDSDIIYIGTGEVYSYQSSIGGLYIRHTRGSYGIGLLKSTDGGLTWQKSLDWAYQQQRGVLAIDINPLNPQVVFAGTSEGTYKSVDGGATWENVFPILMAVDVAVNPVDTNIVYISCGNLYTSVPYPSSMGIYRSMDSGATGTWSRLGNGLPAGWNGKALLSIYKASPNIVFASIGNGHNDNDGTWLCKTTDNGDSWTTVTTQNYSSYQGWFAHYVRVNPADETQVLCAGVNFYRSVDGGATLHSVSGMHVDHHCYADHPTNPYIVYLGNDGGVYRSLNGGLSFQDLSDGYITSQFYPGFASSVLNPNLALGGLQDNGTYMYTGVSAEWVKVGGGDGAYCAINSQNDDIMFISSQRLNVSRSTNGGGSFENISGAFIGADACFVAPYILAPSQPWIVYAGEDLFYRSENMGINWAVMNNGNPLNGSPVLAIAVSFQNPDVVYASTAPSGSRRGELFASINGGIDWQNITGNLPDRYYVDLEVSPHDDLVAYVTLAGFGSSHLYRTEDGGASWGDIGDGLPDVPTSAVIVDPEDHTHIYVGNDLGTYVSTDYGDSWIEFSEDLPTAVIVMDLSISPSNRKLRAATHGNGVYERTLLAPSAVDDKKSSLLVESYELYQNYPNPFSAGGAGAFGTRPGTEISFVLPNSSYLTLKVYNVRGQEVRTLAANGYPAGAHRLSWDGKDDWGQLLPAGSYICRLSAGDIVKTIKMTLIR